ncbi:MAG TPA: immunoglobulin domain-containing protein [Verrucomicrobiae bacterium]|jgi:hypothetical protein
MKQILLLFVLCAALPCLGQAPPPNDNFSNRIALTGNPVAFSGSLVGATLEAGETPNAVNQASLYLGTNTFKSVWWTWTAPQSGLVTVERLSDSIDAYDLDGVAIYNTTNVFSNIEAVAVMKLDQDVLCQTLSFSAGAGTNYQIQLMGSSPSVYQIRLIESNAPLIFQQPRTATVSSNASTLFMVVGEGYRPLSYQWQFEGTNIPGQTVAMLALTNIDGGQAGNYTVVITNIGGVVTSAPAALIVSSTDVQPSLTAINDQAGQFSFVWNDSYMHDRSNSHS